MQTNFSSYSSGSMAPELQHAGDPIIVSKITDDANQAPAATAWSTSQPQPPPTTTTSGVPIRCRIFVADLVATTHSEPRPTISAQETVGMPTGTTSRLIIITITTTRAPGGGGNAVAATTGLVGYNYPSSLLPNAPRRGALPYAPCPSGPRPAADRVVGKRSGGVLRRRIPGTAGTVRQRAAR